MPMGWWRPSPSDFSTVCDMTEYVTLHKVAPDGTSTSYGGIVALGEPQAPHQIASAAEVQMTPATKTWHLDVSSIPNGVIPDREDRIVSTSSTNSGTWVIRSIVVETYGVRYRCETQKLIDY